MLQWLAEGGFMPHGHCYYWRPDILWLHVVSDAVIALAYFSIPLTLLVFVSRRRDVPFRGVLALFAAFIILCGTTHIFGIVTVWQPLYGLEGLVKAVTAAVSIATALLLIPVVPQALAMRSPAELEAANRRLEQEIARRRQVEERLNRALDSLDRSHDELERFAFAASHDLQAPVQAILELARGLQAAPATAPEPLRRIEAGARRIQKLVTDLLELSRIGREREPLQAVPLARVLDGVQRSLQRPLLEAGAELTMDPPPAVLGNERLLGQLFGHLIANALQHRMPGVRPRIHVSSLRDGPEWRITVADNGAGIPAERQRSLFVLFNRPAESGQPEPGIGLPLCRKIVERHGGRIWVESAPGEGSRFHVVLRDAAAGPSPEPGDARNRPVRADEMSGRPLA